MFKKIFFLLLLIVPFCFLSAQKVKTDKIKVVYTQLPSHPVNPEYTTYSTSVYGSSSSIENIGYTRSGLANNLKMPGFKKVDNGGHFRVMARVGYLRIVSNENVKKTKTVGKDENKKTITYYVKNISWKLPVSYTVEDYQGNVLFEGTFGTNTSSQEWGNESSSYVLSQKWGEKGGSVMEGWRKSAVKGHLSHIGNKLRNRFAFQSRNLNVGFESFKGKNKLGADLEGHLKAFETVKTAFAKMRVDEKVDPLKEDVRSAIEFWTKDKDNWSETDKKESRLRHVSLYNLALTYLWLDELDEAKKWATECQKIKWKDGRPKRVISDVEAVRKLFKANGLSTRHPFLDVENAEPPKTASYAAIKESEEEEEEAATTLTGYIIGADGNKIEGDFAISMAEGEELKFGPDGNIIFNYKQDNRPASDELDPAKVKEFSFKDRKFVVQDFVSGAKGNTETKASVLEVLYDSEHICVYKYFPYNDKLGDQKIEYAFKKTAEAAISTSSTQFLLFKKGLTKYFADCPDLAEAVEGGEFTKSEDDIIRAARVYGEVCK